MSKNRKPTPDAEAISIERAKLLLGINDESITLEMLKEKYRVAAKQSHPDRGGSGKQFIRINAAYETLKANPETWRPTTAPEPKQSPDEDEENESATEEVSYVDYYKHEYEDPHVDDPVRPRSAQKSAPEKVRRGRDNGIYEKPSETHESEGLRHGESLKWYEALGAVAFYIVVGFVIAIAIYVILT